MRGFTLVELLVVISIIVIFGIMAFANFKDFSQEQVTNKALGQIKTLLHLAQSNATTSTTCEGEGGVSWAVNFVDSSNIQLICGPQSKVQQTLSLENATIVAIKCSAEGVSFNPPVKVSYSPLSGNLTFFADAQCVKSASLLYISVDSLQRSGNPKSLIISKGGVIQDVP